MKPDQVGVISGQSVLAKRDRDFQRRQEKDGA